MAQYQFPQSEPNFIESHNLELEAGRTRILECYGRTFVCVRSAAGFMMSFNNGKLFDCRNGVEWNLAENERYNLLKFKSGIAQSLKVLTGNFFYHENVVTPVSSVAQTRIKPGPTSIASHAAILFEGVGSVESGLDYRKHFIVSNPSAVELDLLDEDNAPIGTIFPGRMNVFETSADLQIQNPSEGTVNFRVMEIFYLR